MKNLRLVMTAVLQLALCLVVFSFFGPRLAAQTVTAQFQARLQMRPAQPSAMRKCP